MFLANIEREILKFLNEYGQVTKNQLERLFNATDKNIENLIKNQLAVKDGAIIMLRTVKEKDERLLCCIDLLISLMQELKDIEWHIRSGFPFYITFYRNNKAFDITVIHPGEEVLMETALSRSQSKRIIVIAPYKIRALNIDKSIRYYNPEEKKFYRIVNGNFEVE